MAELEQIRRILKEKQSKLETLRESTDKQLVTLIKETQEALQTIQSIETQLGTADTRIRNQKDRISHQQERLAQLRESVTGLDAKIAGLYSTISGDQQQIATLETKLLEMQGRFEVVAEELKQRQALLIELEKQAEERQREIGKRKGEQELELEKQKEERTKAQEGVQKLREKNPIANYLLAEGLEPPELDIIALLIQKEEASMEELKRVVKVPPALATRTIGNLESKGILEVSETGRVRLAKSL